MQGREPLSFVLLEFVKAGCWSYSSQSEAK